MSTLQVFAKRKHPASYIKSSGTGGRKQKTISEEMSGNQQVWNHASGIKTHNNVLS